MVVMFLPATLATGTEQERIATPSTCTVPAPHWAMPQPNFVPVNPISSRNAQRSGISPSMSSACVLPLTLSVTIECLLMLHTMPAVAPIRHRLLGRRTIPQPQDGLHYSQTDITKSCLRCRHTIHSPGLPNSRLCR